MSRTFRKHHPSPGSRPGTLILPEGSPPPRVRVTFYGPEHYQQIAIEDISKFDEVLATAPAQSTIWVDVQGLGEEAPLQLIAERFHIQPLALEDAVNIPQRPKREIYASQQLIVARAPRFEDGSLQLPQVAIFVNERHVVTFQERYLGFFDEVRERIRVGIGPIRAGGPGYLTYALVDALVDHFYPIVERISQQVDELEEEVFENPSQGMLQDLHGLRRSLTVLRRVAWPQREMLREILQLPGKQFGDELRSYLNDTYDHSAQLVDAIDSTRDVARSLVEAHISSLSHRQNEIMKVLTLMASIFIPLTFIAGIYGMNFDNMPELRSRNGYFLVLASMVMVACAMVAYFWRRGWIGRGDR